MTWVLGADTDIPAAASLLGGNQVGSVIVGQALHWMRYRALFHALIPMFRPGGGIAIVTNGTPVWLQDSSWSRAIHRARPGAHPGWTNPERFCRIAG